MRKECAFTEQIIKLIVETDKASRLDVDKALKHREEVTQELTMRKAAIDAQYKKDADIKVTKARIAAQKETENFKEDLVSLEKRKAEKLQRQYDENHEAWEKTIFENITGR